MGYLSNQLTQEQRAVGKSIWCGQFISAERVPTDQSSSARGKPSNNVTVPISKLLSMETWHSCIRSQSYRAEEGRERDAGRSR